MNSKYKKNYFPALFSICVIAIVYYIFSYSEGLVHSDTASKVLFANLQHEQHELFPEGYCYSTGVFTFGTETIIYLLMFFIKDWVLCREVAQLIQFILLIVAFFLFFMPVDVSKKNFNKYVGGMLCTILISFPICDDIFSQFLYEAAYIKNVILFLMIFVCVKKILNDEKSTGKWLWFIILAFFSVITNFGIRNVMLIEVPLLLSVFLCSFNFSSKKFEMSFKEKAIIGVSGFGTLAGFCVYKIITNIVGWGNQTEMFQFDNVKNISKNTVKLFKNILQTYGVGADNSFPLISLKGISISFNFLYMICSIFIIPIFWLFYYKKINNKCWKIFVIYSWISNLFLLYLLVVTSVSAGGGRYLYTLYVNNLILMVGFFIYKIENHKMLGKFAIIYLIFYSLLVHGSYIQISETDVNAKEASNEELINYLKENELNFGYASFWNSYKYTMLTNGEINIVAYRGEPSTPYYWLTSKRWYNPANHEGRTFLLINNKSEEKIQEKFYQKAEQVNYVGDYTVLIFEKNIFECPELMYNDLQEGSKRDIPSSDLFTAGNAYYGEDGNIVIKKDGSQFGPYLELGSGNYQVSVKGDHLSNAEFEVKKGADHIYEDVNIEKKTDKEVIYTFTLDSFYTDIELITSNPGKVPVEVKKMTIECRDRFTDEYYPYQCYCTGNAYYEEGNIVLDSGGEQYGPYESLEAGEYSVKITGENINLAEVIVTSNISEKIPTENLVSDNDIVEFSFKLNEPAEEIEYHIYNKQTEKVKVARLNVRKRK